MTAQRARGSWARGVIERIVTLMMGCIVLVVMLEVFMRGVFGMSLVITEELGRYLMIWTALLGGVLIGMDDHHLKIDVLTAQLGPRLKLAVRILAESTVIAFLCLLIYATCRQLPRFSMQNTLTLGINMAWIYAAIPVSCALLIVPSASRALHALRALLGRGEGDGPSEPGRGSA